MSKQTTPPSTAAPPGDGHGRPVVTAPEFHADDETVTTGHEAIAAMTTWIDADQAKRARWTPEERERAVRYFEHLNAELDPVPPRSGRRASRPTRRSTSHRSGVRQAKQPPTL